jgi:putative membrane protein
MFVRVVVQLIILGVVIWLVELLLPGVHVTGGALTYLWLAVLLSLVNAILGPVLQLIALPLTVLTLGLFALVVNTALVAITAWLSGDLAIDGFWAAFFAALLISTFTAVVTLLASRVARRG